MIYYSLVDYCDGPVDSFHLDGEKMENFPNEIYPANLATKILIQNPDIFSQKADLTEGKIVVDWL